MKRAALFISLLVVSNATFAAWIDVSGNVTSIVTYGHRETILVSLSSAGAEVGGCMNKTGFAISQTMSPEGRARMYAMLLAAKTTDTPVTISYNDVGNCEPWDANQAVYRKITRLR